MRPAVLTVLPDFPFPPTTGLHLRMLSNLRVLQAVGCHSAVLYFQTEEPRPERKELTAYCHEVAAGPRRRPYVDFSLPERVRQRFAFVARALTSSPGRTYPFSVRYDWIGAEERIAAHTRSCGVDVVVLPGFMVHYAPALAQAGLAVILDAIDVLTDLTRSFLTSESRRQPLRAPGLLANHLACRSQERLFLRWCSEVWATSDAEAERLRTIEPRCNVVVVASGINEEAARPTPLPDVDRVGFIGTYSSSPNLDAVEYLVTKVFPLILQQRPRARLSVAGAGLPAGVARRLGRQAGVEILGPVDDSAEFIRSCAVLALPVFVRGGVPLKLVEAMANGRPVVATPQLVAGLPVTNGEDLVVANGAEPFAASVTELLIDRAAASRLGGQARLTFDRHFSLGASVRRVEEQSVLCRPATGPARPGSKSRSDHS